VHPAASRATAETAMASMDVSRFLRMTGSLFAGHIFICWAYFSGHPG
jgi:hypothetical protein